MVDFITYLWVAFSLVIFCWLIYLFARKRIGKVTFVCFLIFVVAGAAGLTGWLQWLFRPLFKPLKAL